MSNIRVRGRKFAAEEALRWLSFRVVWGEGTAAAGSGGRGVFVDWPRGGATMTVRWGGERGFGRGHGRWRQAALPLVAGSSGKIPNSVSQEAQDGIKPPGVDRTVPK